MVWLVCCSVFVVVVAVGGVGCWWVLHVGGVRSGWVLLPVVIVIRIIRSITDALVGVGCCWWWAVVVCGVGGWVGFGCISKCSRDCGGCVFCVSDGMVVSITLLGGNRGLHVSCWSCCVLRKVD